MSHTGARLALSIRLDSAGADFIPPLRHGKASPVQLPIRVDFSYHLARMPLVANKIVKLASQSEAETEATARYHPPAATSDGSPSSLPPRLRTGMPETPMRPTGFLLPLLSGTF
jgi:hypothetical protein